MTEPLLSVRDLRVTFDVGGRELAAVRGVSFDVQPGERIGIVGESGAGKTVTARSILGLLRHPGTTVSGQALLRGEDLLALPPRRLRRVRGAEISMVFQQPVSCLNPTMTVGDQVIEAIRVHERVGKPAARARAAALLGRVGLPQPRERLDDYPHQLSGGMAQRAMIAMAIACEPAIVFADEPTTALDVTIEAQVIDELRELSEAAGTAMLLITHDLGVLARFAERILVMYAGRVVEHGPVDAIFYRPQHPYTRGLIESSTHIDTPARRRLPTIGGVPPTAADVTVGCAFKPRCSLARDRCVEVAPLLQVTGDPGGGHGCACHFPGDLDRELPVRKGRV